MPGLCTCTSIATRNKVQLNNNLCKTCGKHFIEHFYENIMEISTESPIYTNTFEPNIETTSTPFSHEDKYLFGSIQRRPVTTRRRCNSLSNLSPDGLYSQIPLILNRLVDINPIELDNFTENFQLPVPEI